MKEGRRGRAQYGRKRCLAARVRAAGPGAGLPGVIEQLLMSGPGFVDWMDLSGGVAIGFRFVNPC